MRSPETKKTTTSAEELADQLRIARDAHDAAEAAVENAQASFDAQGTPESHKALSERRAEAELARDLVGRAERLLAAAAKRAEEEKRAALDRRAVELQKEIESAITGREPALRKEVEALRAAARAFVGRVRVEEEIGRIERELWGVREQLGDSGATFHTVAHPRPHTHVVATELEKHRSNAEAYERRYLEELIIGIRKHWSL